MRISTIFLARHGQKSGDANTDFGLEQLAASADAFLSEVNISAIYCSDMGRTMQAAEHVLKHRNNDVDSKEVVRHPAFFIKHLLVGENLEELNRVDAILGEHGTTGEWHANWNQAQSLTDGIVAAMTEMAEATVGGNIVVYNHSPLCSLVASIDTPSVGLADIVKYEMVDDGTGWRIASSTLLRCPLTVSVS